MDASPTAHTTDSHHEANMVVHLGKNHPVVVGDTVWVILVTGVIQDMPAKKICIVITLQRFAATSTVPGSKDVSLIAVYTLNLAPIKMTTMTPIVILIFQMIQIFSVALF